MLPRLTFLLAGITITLFPFFITAQTDTTSTLVAQAIVFNDLGLEHYGKGEYQRAIEYHQRALSILLTVTHSEHPKVATSYFDLGNAYESTGDYDQAISCYERALSIRVKAPGKDHKAIAEVYNNLGITYYVRCLIQPGKCILPERKF